MLLQQSLAALSGNTATTDVTLSGSAHYIAGSDDETGTVTLQATSSASRMDLNLSSGPRSEILNTSGAPPAGSWSGPDGVSHPISYHNLLTNPAWFFPAFPIANGLSSSYAATYIGQETRNGQAVQHLSISQIFTFQSPAGVPTMAHLSQMDFFLDATSYLPTAVTFNVHPDNDMGLDIPVEIRFSDYRPVSGTQIPFHIQKSLNNSLLLDLQFQTATINSGLSATVFAVSL